MQTPKNRPLSKYRIRKMLWCFVVDITATQTSELLGINRNTMNRYYNLFRQIIYDYQMERFEKFVGKVELDESFSVPSAKEVFGENSNGDVEHANSRFLESFFVRERSIPKSYPMPGRRPYRLLSVVKSIFAV